MENEGNGYDIECSWLLKINISYKNINMSYKNLLAKALLH